MAVIRIHARHAPNASDAAAVIAMPKIASTDPTNSLVKKNGFVSIGYSRRDLIPQELVPPCPNPCGGPYPYGGAYCCCWYGCCCCCCCTYDGIGAGCCC